MGWDPGMVRHDLESLQMFNQLIRMDSNRITHQSFLLDHGMMNHGNWSVNVCNILNSIDMGENWENLIPVNISIARERLLADYKLMFDQQIADRPKLQNLKTISNSLTIAPHLLTNICKCDRALLS